MLKAIFTMDKLLEKINKLPDWQIAIGIALIGFAIAWTGLTSPFMHDDVGQIVNNPQVHSIRNIPSFFSESTFYNGNARLSGGYYRPLMTVTFALLYELFGLHPFAFHLFQLIIYCAGSFLLYLVLKYYFNTVLSLALSLIFLVHPLNSQVLFAIPSMQDVLFFFFGMLAIWLLHRFESVKSLFAVTVCIFLALMSKESGILFLALALVYLFWFNRKRLLPFAGIVTLPIILYIVLKIHAVGFFSSSNIAPIDHIGLWGRLLTAPSILLLYFYKFIFPMHLATGYYWTYTSLSLEHVVLPFFVDCAVVALAVYLAIILSRHQEKNLYYTYLFFSFWALLGLVVYLQFVPLDFTASESWFYFSMAGMLGMLGVIVTTYGKYIRPLPFIVFIVVLISLLCIRTASRGTDWVNQDKLARIDVSVSPQNFNALNTLSDDLNQQGKHKEAEGYARRSISIFPSYNNYYYLGVSLEGQHDIKGAANAFEQGLQYGESSNLVEKLGEIALVYGDASAKQFFTSSLSILPHDSILWMEFAIYSDKLGDNTGARIAITNASRYGQVPVALYGRIMNHEKYTYFIKDLDQSITIQ